MIITETTLSGEIVGPPIQHRAVDDLLPGIAIPVKSRLSLTNRIETINVVIRHDLMPNKIEPGMNLHATGLLRSVDDPDMDMTYYDFQCRSLSVTNRVTTGE